MPVECINHPGIAARGKCSECGSALCEQCKLTFKNRPVCDACLESIRHKLATDASAIYDTPAVATAIPDIDSQTATRSVDVVLQARESLKEASRPSDTRKVLQGSVIALIVGLILSYLIATLRYDWHYPLGFMHIFVGLAVGFAMVVGARDGGKLQAMAATIISAFSLVSGIYFLENFEYTNTPAPGTTDQPAMLSLSQFFERVGNYPLDWVFVFIGVVAAFMIAKNSKNEVH
jgi:hypothetical protein